MKAELAAAGQRLCLGTGNAFEWLGYWLGAEDRTPERHTLRADLAWLGVALRRLVLLALAVVFYGGLTVTRAWHLIYLVPIGWAAVAWQMSDWSATPPPKEGHPSCSECAGQEPVSVTPSETQKGMWIYGYALTGRPAHTHLHITREVNET